MEQLLPDVLLPEIKSIICDYDIEHVKNQYQQCVLIKKQLQGEFYWFYTNGEILMLNHWLNGEKHGECIEYYENGTIREKSNYLHGKLHSECIKYNRNGEVYTRSNWVNGEQITTCTLL
jgi:calcineurin-like phosphoesterase family protein